MREFQIALIGLFIGMFLMVGFNTDDFDRGYQGDRITSNTSFSPEHPVDEKFGGGVRISDDGAGRNVNVDPTGSGGN